MARKREKRMPRPEITDPVHLLQWERRAYELRVGKLNEAIEARTGVLKAKKAPLVKTKNALIKAYLEGKIGPEELEEARRLHQQVIPIQERIKEIRKPFNAEKTHWSSSARMADNLTTTELVNLYGPIEPAEEVHPVILGALVELRKTIAKKAAETRKRNKEAQEAEAEESEDSEAPQEMEVTGEVEVEAVAS